MASAPTYFEPLTPLRFVERAGRVHRDRIAVVDEGLKYSYGQFLSRCRRLASALSDSGLRKGDRVAFLALNSEPLLLAHFAIPMASGVLVAINTRLAPSEVAYIVRHSGAKWLFYSPALAEAVSQLRQGVRTVALNEDFQAFLATGSDGRAECSVTDEGDSIAIDYTSGTTGKPKGVVYRHRGAYLNALGMVIENRLTVDSRVLWTLPMFHCNGWSHTWAVVAAGATSICLARVNPEEVWELLDRERVTHFMAAPTVLAMLASHPAAHPLESTVRVCTGGAAPTPALVARMELLNIELVHLYGMTETYGPVSINLRPPGFDSLQREERACMIARQGVSHITASRMRVVDADMQDVPADGRTMGEIVVAGNTTMKCYYRDRAATADAFRGGWFHTGDVAVLHDDGNVEIFDRTKDIIISGGENISTIEVEAVLADHPAVMECAVVGIPDEVWGEVAKAYVTVRPGLRVAADELKTHCRSRMAHFKCPKEFEFGPLQKTSTGKIQKFVLRQRSRANPIPS